MSRYLRVRCLPTKKLTGHFLIKIRVDIFLLLHISPPKPHECGEDSGKDFVINARIKRGSNSPTPYCVADMNQKYQNAASLPPTFFLFHFVYDPLNFLGKIIHAYPYELGTFASYAVPIWLLASFLLFPIPSRFNCLARSLLYELLDCWLWLVTEQNSIVSMLLVSGMEAGKVFNVESDFVNEFLVSGTASAPQHQICIAIKRYFSWNLCRVFRSMRTSGKSRASVNVDNCMNMENLLMSEKLYNN